MSGFVLITAVSTVAGVARAEEPVAASVASAAVPPGPVVVAAIGDGLVAGALPAEVEAGRPASETSGSGWVPVLADCLEERAPQRFSVVDRAVAAETVASARQRVASLRELAPAVVVVTLGAQELSASPAADLKPLRGELDALLGELQRGRRATRPAVLLLSVVPANLAQTGVPLEAPVLEALQREIDQQVAAWNDALAQVAKGNDGAVHVNLLGDWPGVPAPGPLGPGLPAPGPLGPPAPGGEARAALTEGGWALSAQGHARVAAAVCDAVLAK